MTANPHGMHEAFVVSAGDRLSPAWNIFSFSFWLQCGSFGQSAPSLGNLSFADGNPRL